MRAALLAVASLVAPLVSPSEVQAPECSSVGALQHAVEEPIDVNLDWLTSLDYRRGMKLPDEILALDGQEIAINGYMAIGTLEARPSSSLCPSPASAGARRCSTSSRSP